MVRLIIKSTLNYNYILVDNNDLSAAFQNVVVGILSKKTMHALNELGIKNLIVAGGVAANQGLKEKLTELCEMEDISLSIPPMKYCTDNAAMIGAAAYYAYKQGNVADLTLNAKATVKLSDNYE